MIHPDSRPPHVHERGHGAQGAVIIKEETGRGPLALKRALRLLLAFAKFL